MAYESDPIAQKLNQLVCDKELYMDLEDFRNLHVAEQALIGTWELANEVYNGGFTQYFHNSSRDRAKLMIDVLRSIDAPGAAAILESAIALAGPGTRWGDERDYLAAIKSMPDDLKNQLRELERNLYSELDDLHLQVFRYLSKHRNLVDAPADFWTEATIQ
ncbi:MAG: hypothetical protein QOG83_1375 [Alphaproteobacteria bacterium]|jgi:hypothetical protein|nr:hypothetical protein [Alphaproteobacteria bacterium]MEA2988664.1 hypothetical protein [Alphaproteobacteria bacterium]